MKKSVLAKAVAKRNRLKTGDAADQVDRAVTQIIRKLRGGEAARLPGLGTIEPGKPWKFRPERDPSDDR
jgi:nucleoid DNA-binding protein